MANVRETTSARKPTISGEAKANRSPEHHVNVVHNSGPVIAGDNNTITTYNVYNYLNMIQESSGNNNKKTSQKQRNRKKTRQEKVESDAGECSKYSEQAKGKKLVKNRPRKEGISKETREESNNEHDDEEFKDQEDQEFITTSEEEIVDSENFANCRSLARKREAEKSSVLRYRSQNKKNSKKDTSNFDCENESQLAYHNTSKSGDFSPSKVALRQTMCFAACTMFCWYFEAISFLPFLFWLIFVANNLLACFSCIKLTFKTINCQDMQARSDNNRSFIAIARLQVDFFIKEENILQKLFASLLCVSLAFVSSQVFGCATCLWMQTIVVTIVSTSPYFLFKDNFLLTSVLSEHCRVFKAGLGLEPSEDVLC